MAEYRAKIGGTALARGLILAPMAGYTDSAFRLLCTEAGAEYTVSEMLSATAVCFFDKSTFSLAQLFEGEAPCAVQLFGHDPETVGRAAAMLSDGSRTGGIIPAAIDINMGCPVRKIVSNREGSALMRDLPLAAKIIESAVRATSLPVTVKMRSGFDGEHINAPELAHIAEEAGASAVCVHARTRDQMYSGRADMSVVASVREKIKIPLIANGDITCGADAERVFRETGCNAVAIGRAAVGKPYIFAEIAAYLDGKPYTAPSGRERAALAMRQLRLAVERKGSCAITEARHHLSAYLAGERGAAAARMKLMSTTDIDEIEKILYSVLDR